MNFNLQRHTRLAGTVAIFVGLYLHNWSVVLLGNLVTVIGYMITIAKVEQYIEEQTKEKDNASSEER